MSTALKDALVRRIEEALDDFERLLMGPSFDHGIVRRKKKAIMALVHDLRTTEEKGNGSA